MDREATAPNLPTADYGVSSGSVLGWLASVPSEVVTVPEVLSFVDKFIMVFSNRCKIIYTNVICRRIPPLRML